MANVTFSSPIMPKDVTVYAVAGDKGTLLALARKNDIPIPCQCQDGQCGSCLVKVTPLDGSSLKGQALTEHEKVTLSVNGKLSKELLAKAEVEDIPPPYRLACQYWVQDSNILVEFSGEPGVEIDLRR
ncbi:MAG: (2Fe-2S)-binding protein [Opitutae bacterium]|uniref:Ferredoxin n=1 Tax=Pararhodospirillum oryzae TaxID=478448 RepID=A0A512HC83_9PROT|nr:2Fe-2S iron-sulfur cluster-binding protein [Pararhodospirillum oryzae]NCA83758.1 (2Fe-2S)-binding protein [Opitutae bacterium]GEO83000.1 ferredoxin [Pararhodospirillum oryzae]